MPSLIGLAVVLTALAVFISERAARDPASLDHTAWTATTINGDPVVQPAPQVRFSGDGLSGNTGCNDFWTNFQVEDGAITTGGGGVNNRGCSPEGGPQEQAFLTVIGGDPAFEVDGDTLTLDSPKGDITFTRNP